MTVYLLWLHDCVLDVFSTRRKALLAAHRFINRPEWRACTWTRSRDGLRWHITRAWKSGHPVISRLEVEERRVL